MDKKVILVIDDQRDTQVLLKKCLETEGYDVKQAWNGKDGLWKVLEHKPDLILVDVIMPEMNGIEFVTRLRDIDKGDGIPVIVISKRALIVNCFDEGIIEGFFPKPIDTKGLLEKIAMILKKGDVLEFLAKIEQERTKCPDPIKRTGEKNRMKREVCKRCAHVLSVEEEYAEKCPNCGYPGFFVQEIYE